MIHSQFAYIFLFVLAGFMMLTIILLIARYLRPSKASYEKLTTYESGEETTGDALVNFGSRYYVVALVFILFEVELVLLFPWSTVFGNEEKIVETAGSWGWFSLTEMFVFILVLGIGLVYAWAQGHLEWTKPVQKKSELTSPVPRDLYNQLNKKYS